MTVSLTEALSTLTNMGSEETIAGYLYDEGYRGIPGMADWDPCGEWLATVTGAETARVSGYMVELVFPGGRVESDFTPTVIAELTDRFDQGSFPFLLVPNSAEFAA